MARVRHGKTIAKLVVGVILLAVAVVGLTYGSMLREMDRASQDYARGEMEAALVRYDSVEEKVRSMGAIRLIPGRDRQNLFLNQARLLYAMEKYDEAAERLEHENEVTGTFTDGRFFLVRGNIAFRKAILNYRQSRAKDLRVLEEALRGAEENMREALRLMPEDWDAKYNFEFITMVRKALSQNDQGQMKVLMEEVEKPQPKALLPEQQG